MNTVKFAGKGNVGICSGDVGDPLAVNGKLIGVASFWFGNCKSGYPSVYTRVNNFTNWIEAKSDIQYR